MKQQSGVRWTRFETQLYQLLTKWIWLSHFVGLNIPICKMGFCLYRFQKKFVKARSTTMYEMCLAHHKAYDKCSVSSSYSYSLCLSSEWSWSPLQLPTHCYFTSFVSNQGLLWAVCPCPYLEIMVKAVAALRGWGGLAGCRHPTLGVGCCTSIRSCTAFVLYFTKCSPQHLPFSQIWHNWAPLPIWSTHYGSSLGLSERVWGQPLPSLKLIHFGKGWATRPSLQQFLVPSYSVISYSNVG